MSLDLKPESSGITNVMSKQLVIEPFRFEIMFCYGLN